LFWAQTAEVMAIAATPASNKERMVVS